MRSVTNQFGGPPVTLHEKVTANARGDDSFKGDKAYDWFELYINLFYLAFLIKLGDIFLFCTHSLEIYLYTIAMFMGIYMNKFEMDLYLSKYGFNDVVNKTFLVVYSVGIFLMILNVNATSVEHGSSGISVHFHQDCHEYRSYVVGFSVGWIVTRGSVLVMHLLTSYTLSDTHILVSKVPILVISLLIITLNLILREDRYDDDFSSVQFLLSAALVEYLGFAFWQMFVVGTLLHSFLQHNMATVKVNIHRQTMRTAAFGLITLGVNVVELMTPVLHSSAVTHYISLCLGFVIILSLAMNFFDVIPAKGCEHALSNSKLQGTAWMMMQPVLSYCMFGVGMIVKMLLAEDVEQTLHEVETAHSLGIFLGLASLLLVLIRLTHRSRSSMNKGRYITAFCRLLISVGHVLVGYLPGDSLHMHASLAIHAALCAAYVAVDAAKYYRKDIFYLKVWSMLAREHDDRSASGMDSEGGGGADQLEATNHSVRSQSGSGQIIRFNRNLSEANIRMSPTEIQSCRKIQIPGRFMSSSAIFDAVNQPQQRMQMSKLPSNEKISLPRKVSEGKILLHRKHSEGQISMPRQHSEGKILLPRKPSEGMIVKARRRSGAAIPEGKIQMPRSMSSASFLSSRNNSFTDPQSPLGEGGRRKVVIRRRSRPLDKSPPSTPRGPIEVSRKYKSSTDISSSLGAGRGAVVKNDKGQFVLEKVVDTADGGQKVQQTVLRRVLTKKTKKGNDGGGTSPKGGRAGSPSTIVVRRIKSSENTLHKGKSGVDSSLQDIARNQLESDCDEDEDGGDEKKDKPSELSSGSSVLLVEDEEGSELNQGISRTISLDRSVRLTPLLRGVSVETTPNRVKGE